MGSNYSVVNLKRGRGERKGGRMGLKTERGGRGGRGGEMGGRGVDGGAKNVAYTRILHEMY